MCVRVAMLSLHTSPLAPLGRTRDAGGMNVYVRELSRELGRDGILVDVFTRWTDPADPPIEPLGDRVRLIRVAAGPIAPLPTGALLPYVDEFAHRILRFARLVGRENVIAGTDCGFAQAQFIQRAAPSVMWAKFEALVEGARIASAELWQKSRSVA